MWPELRHHGTQFVGYLKPFQPHYGPQAVVPECLGFDCGEAAAKPMQKTVFISVFDSDFFILEAELDCVIVDEKCDGVTITPLLSTKGAESVGF